MTQDPNVFAGAFVDRSGERRKDPDWLAEALSHPDTRFVPVWGDRCLIGGDPPRAILLERSMVEEYLGDDVIFLGLFRQQPVEPVVHEIVGITLERIRQPARQAHYSLFVNLAQGCRVLFLIEPEIWLLTVAVGE